MDQEPKVERESKPLVTDLLSDPDEIARREARNALRQFDAAVKIVDDALESNASFRLRPQALAGAPQLKQLFSVAG